MHQDAVPAVHALTLATAPREYIPTGWVHASLACASEYVCFAFLPSDVQGPLFSAMEKAHEDVSMLAHIADFLIFLSVCQTRVSLFPKIKSIGGLCSLESVSFMHSGGAYH